MFGKAECLTRMSGMGSNGFRLRTGNDTSEDGAFAGNPEVESFKTEFRSLIINLHVGARGAWELCRIAWKQSAPTPTLLTALSRPVACTASLSSGRVSCSLQ